MAYGPSACGGRQPAAGGRLASFCNCGERRYSSVSGRTRDRGTACSRPWDAGRSSPASATVLYGQEVSLERRCAGQKRRIFCNCCQWQTNHIL